MLKWKAPATEMPARSPTLTPAKCQRVFEVEGRLDDEDSGREVGGLSRSAAATRKLRKLMKLGRLVLDEQKKAIYKQKCLEMDMKARFHYNKKWEVLHSKCGKWFAMSEPYNTTRFRNHIEDCRLKGQNGLIDDFFKRWDTNEKGVVTKVAKPAGRKHIHWGQTPTYPGFPL